MTTEWAACTIVSKNYLAYARVLARSFRERHPGVRFFVLLVDRVEDAFDPATEPFELVTADELDQVPDPRALFFKYTVVELNTALKPFFLSHLLRRHGFGKLVFLDPDILVLDSLEPIRRLLDVHDVVVTPHLLQPIDDHHNPGEIEILQAGTFNLGFIAVTAACDRELLPWWRRRLFDHCAMEPALGMHVDQKWIDLAPCFFPRVHVLRDPTYNIAYWNLQERASRMRRVGDRWMLGDDPIRFFHFSGVDVTNLEQISKHQDRYRLADLPRLRELFERYRDRLLAEGQAAASGYRYAFGGFDNGAAIPREARTLYRELGDRAGRFGDPFATAASDSFFRYLNQGVDQVRDPARSVSRLWWQIYGVRTDVQRVYPDALQRDRDGLLGWIKSSGAAEHKVDARLCPADRGPDEVVVVPRGDDRLLPRLYAAAIAPREAKVRSVVERFIRPGSRQWRALGELRLRIGGIVPPSGGPVAAPHRRPVPAPLPWGVNVSGYLTSEKGMGEAVRANIRHLEAAGIPYVLNDFVDTHNSENRERVGATTRDNPYRINIINVNADQVDQFVLQRGSDYLTNRYNIAVWMWELSEFPAAWRSRFELFDEIWVASSFVLDAISRESSIPVVRFPLSMAPTAADGPVDLTHLEIPRGFVFLFVFDFCSLAARKNPLGVIEAFKRAFASKEGPWLIIKCAHSEVDPDGLAAMRAAAAGANIRIIDRVIERAELRGLMARADCYVSLHRSEGFGLTIAEAMSMGKPVIATAYSGNVDFMTAGNSLPVPYDLSPLDRDHGPYQKGRVWADPDLGRAAEAMRYVVAQPDAARAIGARAARDIATMLSPAAIGAMVERRLRAVAGDG